MGNPLAIGNNKQEELTQQHSSLFALIANGTTPIKAGEILGYTPEAVSSIIAEYNQVDPLTAQGQHMPDIGCPSSFKTLEEEEQYIQRARTRAIYCLVNVMESSDNDTARVAASKVILSIENGQVNESGVERLREAIDKMKRAVVLQEKVKATKSNKSDKAKDVKGASSKIIDLEPANAMAGAM